MAAQVVEVETVAARRPFAGVGSFTVHVEPTSPLRAGLVRWRPPVRGRTVTTAAVLVAAVLSAGAVGLVVRSAGARGSTAVPTPRESSLPAAATPVWIEVVRPIPLFDLGGSTFGRLPLVYRVKRLSDASERRDTLTYGVFGAETAALTLTIHRLGIAPRRADLPAELARVVAFQKLALLRGGPPTPVPTRFGALEAADLTVGSDTRSRPCLGFQSRTDGGPAPVAISGLACGTGGKPMDRAGLTCVLDHLDLLSAGDDTALRDFFVAAEQRRGQGCGTTNLSATRPRPTWLDGEAVEPPLEIAGTHRPSLRLPSRGPSEL